MATGYDLEHYKNVMSQLTALIECTTETKLLTAYTRLQRRLKSEQKVLEKQSQRSNKSSSNLPYLYGVFDVVQQSSNVQQIICDLRKYKLIIDVICDGGKTWKKVVARNPQSLHLIWASKGEYGTKDAVGKLEKFVEAAKKESDFSPPKVVGVFTNGVTCEMAEYLQSIGVTIEGERVAVSSDTIRRLQITQDSSEDEYSDDEEVDSDRVYSDDSEEDEAVDSLTSALDPTVEHILSLQTDNKIFMDVTSMVIYVSDVCNGGSDFPFKDQLMADQAEQERATPVKPLITNSMANRKLITCQTALENFKNFVKLLGGEKEQERAEELIVRLTVVPDQLSHRFQRLKKGGKIKDRSATIFGTADMLKCNILTSNESFIRAAAAQGIAVSAIIHQSRALSELKRREETEAAAADQSYK